MGVSKQTVYLWYTSMVAASCMNLYGYDAAAFNALQGSANWRQHFNHPDPNVIGSVNTAYTVGCVISGFFVSAPISNYLGRRWAMMIGCIFVIIASFLAAFSPRNIGAFIGAKALVGIGQGITLPAGPVYISEITPAKTRGAVMSFWQLFFSVGNFLGFWIAFACSKNSEKLRNWDWKIVMLCQMIAPAFIVSSLWACPESPRWYIQKNRTEEAVAALSRIRNTREEVDAEIEQIQLAVAFEQKNNISGSYGPLWKDPSVRARLILAILMNVGQQCTGQGSLNNYSTIIFQKVFKDNDTIQLLNALNATLGIFFTLTATFTIDRFGRRFLLLVGAIGMSTCMLIVAILVTQAPDLGEGLKSQPVAIGTVFIMFLFGFFFKPSWGATVWVWTSEIFSMNVRSQAVAMSTQAQNVANAVLLQLFPLFLANEGFYAMYMFFAMNLFLAFFVYFFIPETKGKTLESMDILFGGEDHAEDTTPDDPRMLGSETTGHVVPGNNGEKKAVEPVVSSNITKVKVNDAVSGDKINVTKVNESSAKLTNSSLITNLQLKELQSGSSTDFLARLALNFKGLDYKTVWVEYPDIKPTFSPEVPPNPAPDTPYTIPAIRFPSTGLIMHSRTIAARLEELYPEPSLHLDSPIMSRIYGIQGKHIMPVYGLWIPLVSANILNPRSKEYYDRTREADEGMTLPELLAKTEAREEEAWESARTGLRELGGLLEENAEGPFFMGSVAGYADLVVLSWLEFYKRIDKERLFDKVVTMEPSLGRLYEAGKQWLERNDH
ncbi:hypothetical protein O988_01925 [Pseudogymnoascus sp. VKM F-3808]|nr:hypothetical protein O988_01925 [Pseudogymnoascus sp. VKM F-3808]